jgi:hypothetical protein
MDETARLRAELDELNRKCQTARDNEVRYGLQRSRLETERAQLLFKLMEAMSPPTVAPIAAPASYHVTIGPAVAVKGPLSITPKIVADPFTDAAAIAKLEAAVDNTNVVPLRKKPNGLPTLNDMIATTLKGVGAGLRPIQIVQSIRREWWKDMPRERVYQSLYRLVQHGRLRRHGDRYKLTAINGANGAAGNAHDTAGPP